MDAGLSRGILYNRGITVSTDCEAQTRVLTAFGWLIIECPCTHKLMHGLAWLPNSLNKDIKDALLDQVRLSSYFHYKAGLGSALILWE